MTETIDPLAEIVALLQPNAGLSKLVECAGRWSIHRTELGQPFYYVLLDGACRLTIDGQEPVILQEGDFVLIPAAYGFTNSSLEAPSPQEIGVTPVELSPGHVRLGYQDGEPDVRLLVGHCAFGSPDAALLVSLLPQMVLVRGEPRLSTLVQLVREESRDRRPARDVILARLLEVLFIEALRSTAGPTASPGLVRGLMDKRLAAAIRRMHESPTRPWTVPDLAKEAALSRSTFFERFSREVGVTPMDYLLGWRMALAKNLLRKKDGNIAEIAERVGYASASTFSVAFTRFVGMPPTHYRTERFAEIVPRPRAAAVTQGT
jgi:AraC-like DNA-binding protein